MKQFEYKEINFIDGIPTLDLLGREGWQLIQLSPPTILSHTCTGMFMREIEGVDFR